MLKSEKDKIIAAYDRLANAANKQDVIECRSPFGSEYGIRISDDDYFTLMPLIRAKCVKHYSFGKDIELNIEHNMCAGSFFQCKDGVIYRGLKVPEDLINTFFADLVQMVDLIARNYKKIKIEDLYDAQR